MIAQPRSPQRAPDIVAGYRSKAIRDPVLPRSRPPTAPANGWIRLGASRSSEWRRVLADLPFGLGLRSRTVADRHPEAPFFPALRAFLVEVGQDSRTRDPASRFSVKVASSLPLTRRAARVGLCRRRERRKSGSQRSTSPLLTSPLLTSPISRLPPPNNGVGDNYSRKSWEQNWLPQELSPTPCLLAGDPAQARQGAGAAGEDRVQGDAADGGRQHGERRGGTLAGAHREPARKFIRRSMAEAGGSRLRVNSGQPCFVTLNSAEI